MILFSLLLLFILVMAIAMLVRPSGREHSVAWHATHGKWQVIYPDGAKSQRFTRAVADDYQKLFGGQVVRAED